MKLWQSQKLTFYKLTYKCWQREPEQTHHFVFYHYLNLKRPLSCLILKCINWQLNSRLMTDFEICLMRKCLIVIEPQQLGRTGICLSAPQWLSFNLKQQLHQHTPAISWILHLQRHFPQQPPKFHSPPQKNRKKNMLSQRSIDRQDREGCFYSCFNPKSSQSLTNWVWSIAHHSHLAIFVKRPTKSSSLSMLIILRAELSKHPFRGFTK